MGAGQVNDGAADPDELRFCCQGCQRVYEFLQGAGLGRFYDLRSTGGLTRPDALRPPPDRHDLAIYDSPAFAERYIRPTHDGQVLLRWAVGGLHCAACVWLLEQLPQLCPGVTQARVDFADESLLVVWDPEQVQASVIALQVESLGYHLRPFGDPEGEARARDERRRWLLRLAIAVASAVGSMHLSWSVLAGHATASMPRAETQFFGLLAIIVALPALVWSAGPFWAGAWRGLLAGRFTVDATVAVVLVFGLLVSLLQVFRASPEIYVDALAMFVAFLLVGRVVLFWTRDLVRRRHARGLSLLPMQATRIDQRGPEETAVSVASTDLMPGDRVRVLAGELLPCDGDLLQAEAYCDTAVLTGEARSVRFRTGEELCAGFRAVGGDLLLRCAKVGDETRLGSILAQARAGSLRPTALSMALDRVQWWFAPVVLVLAGLTFALWSWLDPGRAWEQAIAVVLVACPCALGLAAPLLYAVVTARAARQGVIIRDPGALETLGGIRHLVLDKTGTITQGRIRLVDWQWQVPSSERAGVLGVVRELERRASHPLAQTLVAAIDEAVIDGVSASQPVVTAVREVIGQGVEGLVGDERWRIGSAAFLGSDLSAGEDRTAVQAGTTNGAIGVSRDGSLVLQLAFADPLRQDIVAWLKDGPDLTVHLLSGDRPQQVQGLADELAIDDAWGACSPEAKAARVTELAAQAPTAMAGDGVNDALALQAAHVGIGLRGGLEAALAQSDIYLTDPDRFGLPTLVREAGRVRHELYRALIWSLVYNIVAVALVMAGWWGPYVCAVAMPLSSIAVVCMVLQGRAFIAGDPAIRPRALHVPASQPSMEPS